MIKFPKPKTKHVELETMTAIISRIMRETGRDYIRGYAFAIFCLLLVAGTTAFTAWIMEDIINEAFASKDSSSLWLICGSILAAFIIRGFASYGQAVTLAQIGNNIVARYQQRVIDHLMALNVSWFSNNRSTHIAAQIAQNVSGIRDVMNMTITSFARDLITLLGLVVVMVAKDPFLSLVAVIIAPPVVLSLRYISRRIRSVTRESIVINSRVLGAMQEAVQGITVVKAFTMEEQISKRSGELIRAAEEKSNRIARLSERTSPLTETIAGFAISGVVAYASYRLIYSGELPGSFIAFITALLLAYDPARRLARLQVSLERAVVNARMIYEILDTKPKQADAPDAGDLSVTAGRIAFEDVSFAYDDGERVLDHVSFVAEPGKMTAFVGPSGAGKSTLINLLPRFYDVHEGRILIDDTDIMTVKKASLREQLSYVSQQPYLFDGTIRENITLGLDVDDDVVRGVGVKGGIIYQGRTIVLTTGTFLRGKIHVGDFSYAAGRAGETSADAASEGLVSLGFEIGRMKTGTPPRVNGRSIDFAVLEEQPGDDPPRTFSYAHDRPLLPQRSCYITYTNAATHDMIRENLERSAMYSGDSG